MRIVFFGTPHFSIPSLSALYQSDEEIIAVVTQPDKRKGRGHKYAFPPVKKFALEKQLLILQPENINDNTFLDKLRDLNPEIIIVVSYGKILSKQILTLPFYGCINVHASLLPKYRGAAPIQWALINGEEKTGITTILMDKGLDTGNILLQEVIEISYDDTSESLSHKLANLGASVLLKTIQGIKTSSIKPYPQIGTPTYAPILKKEDGRINWTKTAKEIYNFIRGMYPWPCAYCYLNNERIKIIKAKILEGSGIPGRIEKATNELIIGTAEGLISIIELKPDGKKLMPANAFLHGRHIKEGEMVDKT